MSYLNIGHHIRLARQGRAKPLLESECQVPVVCCRGCRTPRPDDGTRCQSCGAYQHCILNALPFPMVVCTSSVAKSAKKRKSKRKGKQPKQSPAKPVNPRRRNKNAA